MKTASFIGIIVAVFVWAPLVMAAAPTSQPAKTTIVLVGDSTVTPNAGWGNGFASSMDGDVKVINLSRGGRSSKSFIAEGSWKKCLDLKPDYVMIQFGHNDQPGHPGNRETDPQTTYRQYMNQYVDDARSAGIKPVLVTSMSRRQWGADGKIHSTLSPYVAVVKEIAGQKNVPLIDLHSLSIAFYEQIGKAGCDALSPWKAPTKTGTKGSNAGDTVGDALPPTTEPVGASRVLDGTHLNAKGSAIIGPMIAAELAKVVPELAPHIHCDNAK